MRERPPAGPPVAAYLMGFYLAGDYAESDLYACFVQDEECQLEPICQDDFMLLFTRKEHLEAVMEGAGIDAGLLKRDETALYQVSWAVHIIEEEAEDTGCFVVNLINMLDDVLWRTKVPIPERKYKPLFDLADHLTFSADVEGYFRDNTVIRTDCADALLWMIGTAFTHSTFYIPDVTIVQAHDSVVGQ